MKKWLLNQIGLGHERLAQPLVPLLVAPGLEVTRAAAWAWLVIETSNTDHRPDTEIVKDLEGIVKEAGQHLEGLECHLKVVWDTYSGAQYLEDSAHLWEGGLGDGEKLFTERAERIDELNIPRRHVYLGVRVASRSTVDTAQTGQAMEGLTGPRTVPANAVAQYTLDAARVEKAFATTALRVRLASPGEIAWMLARETRRFNPVASGALLEGASVTNLLRSHVRPHADFVEYLDEMGGTIGYGCFLVMNEFPASAPVPGIGMWAKNLGSVTRQSVKQERDGSTSIEQFAVLPEISIRFIIHTRPESVKVAKKVITRAKEQRIEAARSTMGEVGQEWDGAEEEAGWAIDRARSVRLVESHPRIFVFADTLDGLDASVTATVSYLGQCGIEAVRASDEQRELFLEAFPGDTVRITDLQQWQDSWAFWGAYFWGGSIVDNDGPVAATLNGSTTGLYRENVSGYALNGSTTSILNAGESGMGKTNAIMVDVLNAATLGPAASIKKPGKLEEAAAAGMLENYGLRAFILDVKDDLEGLAKACKHYSIPYRDVAITSEYSGAADMFTMYGTEQRELDAARSTVPAMLADLATLDQGYADAVCIEAVQEVMDRAEEEGTRPTTWDVIQYLLNKEGDEDANKYGVYLRRMASSPLGKVVMGPPAGKAFFTNEPGITRYTIPTVEWDLPGDNPRAWNMHEKASAAVVSALFANIMVAARDKSMGLSPKLVVIPEVQSFLRTRVMVNRLESLPRMGRAWNVQVYMDTQTPSTILAHTGIAEQLASVRIFQLSTAPEIQAAKQLLRTENDGLDSVIKGLAYNEADPSDDIKGSVLTRDRSRRVGQILFDMPNRTVQDFLNTNPDRVVGQEQHEEEELSA